MSSETPSAPVPARPSVRLRVPGSRQHLFFFRKMVVKPDVFIEAGAIVDVVDRTGVTRREGDLQRDRRQLQPQD